MDLAKKSKPFNPSEDELITDYLLNRVMGNPLPAEVAAAIRECDLYGKEEPWEIWERHGGPREGSSCLYFFTRLKKGLKSTRFTRLIGKGKWEGETGFKRVGQFGLKKMLSYEGKNGSSPQEHRWVMHEYSLDLNSIPQPIPNQGYVLCRITRKPKVVKKRRRRSQAAAAGQNIPDPGAHVDRDMDFDSIQKVNASEESPTRLDVGPHADQPRVQQDETIHPHAMQEEPPEPQPQPPGKRRTIVMALEVPRPKALREKNPGTEPSLERHSTPGCTQAFTRDDRIQGDDGMAACNDFPMRVEGGDDDDDHHLQEDLGDRNYDWVRSFAQQLLDAAHMEDLEDPGEKDLLCIKDGVIALRD